MFLPDTDPEQLELVLEFLYTGQTGVEHSQLPTFLNLARQLQIAELDSKVTHINIFDDPEISSPLDRMSNVLFLRKLEFFPQCWTADLQ